jgi:hypothetical protein
LGNIVVSKADKLPAKSLVNCLAKKSGQLPGKAWEIARQLSGKPVQLPGKASSIAWQSLGNCLAQTIHNCLGQLPGLRQPKMTSPKEMDCRKIKRIENELK